MTGFRTAFYSASVAALSIGLTGIAQAQDAAQPASEAPQPETFDGDIVVTASKREQNLNDVGMTVTAISGDDLDERRITSVQDIAAAIPGLKFA